MQARHDTGERGRATTCASRCRSVGPAPAARLRAYHYRFAVQQHLLCVWMRGGQCGNVEVNVKRARHMRVFDRKLPRQEDLHAMLIQREVARTKTAAVATDYTMRLAGVEYQRRAARQRNTLTCAREMHVEALVFGEEEIAERRAAILLGVVVIPRAAARHQRYVARGQHARQSE